VKKMPRKTHANCTQVENLLGVKKLVTKPTVEEVEDCESVNLPHTPISPKASLCRHDDITSDPELLNIIGVIRGAVMVDDKDDSSDSGSDDDGDDEWSAEIQKIIVLEHFTSILQRAHDVAIAAEREREKGKKRPKMYCRNSDRTKWQCRQRGHELAAKGFYSVKDWLPHVKQQHVAHQIQIC
jgi:hypothetical protein